MADNYWINRNAEQQHIQDEIIRDKAYKEEFIKNMAMRYKEKIPGKVYNAMMDWKVEIDD